MFPRNKPLPSNPDLVLAIQEARENPCGATFLAVNTKLLESTLIVPVTSPDGSTLSDPIKDTDLIQMIPLPNDQGQLLIPVFTDSESLYRWRPEGGAVITMGNVNLFRWILQNASPTAVVINTNGRERWHVPRLVLEALSDGVAPSGNGESGQISFSFSDWENANAQSYPGRLEPELEIALGKALRSRNEILAAYILSVSYRGKGSRTMIGIEIAAHVDLKNKRSFLTSLMNELLPVLKNQYLDLCILTNPMLGNARETGDPFYRRVNP